MKHILVPARTNSEWDSVSFALIPMSQENIDFLNDVRQKGEPIFELHGHVTISADNADFFLIEDDEENNTMEQNYGFNPDKNSDPILIDITEEEIEKLKRPEQHLKYGKLRVFKGAFEYLSYGKHTDEEFFTELISFDFINSIK